MDNHAETSTNVLPTTHVMPMLAAPITKVVSAVPAKLVSPEMDSHALMLTSVLMVTTLVMPMHHAPTLLVVSLAPVMPVSAVTVFSAWTSTNVPITETTVMP